MTCGWHAATVASIGVTAWKRPPPGRRTILPGCALRSGGWKSLRSVWVKRFSAASARIAGRTPIGTSLRWLMGQFSRGYASAASQAKAKGKRLRLSQKLTLLDKSTLPPESNPHE